MHGYERTTATWIARAAGLSSGSVFHHFKEEAAVFRLLFGFSIPDTPSSSPATSTEPIAARPFPASSTRAFGSVCSPPDGRTVAPPRPPTRIRSTSTSEIIRGSSTFASSTMKGETARHVLPFADGVAQANTARLRCAHSA
ncbi:helix-turn-helix domain-containing protein [Nocardia sp. NPDC006044]|uniref:helix-turn-helix domain-containing protein n=1 Tax=Nocardia sp. NPDC006044 TaxID=3364306 RepID=UPI0036CEE2B7